MAVQKRRDECQMGVQCVLLEHTSCTECYRHHSSSIPPDLRYWRTSFAQLNSHNAAFPVTHTFSDTELFIWFRDKTDSHLDTIRRLCKERNKVFMTIKWKAWRSEAISQGITDVREKLRYLDLYIQIRRAVVCVYQSQFSSLHSNILSHSMSCKNVYRPEAPFLMSGLCAYFWQNK